MSNFFKRGLPKFLINFESNSNFPVRLAKLADEGLYSANKTFLDTKEIIQRPLEESKIMENKLKLVARKKDEKQSLDREIVKKNCLTNKLEKKLKEDNNNIDKLKTQKVKSEQSIQVIKERIEQLNDEDIISNHGKIMEEFKMYTLANEIYQQFTNTNLTFESSHSLVFEIYPASMNDGARKSIRVKLYSENMKDNWRIQSLESPNLDSKTKENFKKMLYSTDDVQTLIGCLFYIASHCLD